MCVSFVYRGEDTLVAMNFDNDGKRFKIDTSNPKCFLVVVQRDGKVAPGFGINSDGVFANSSTMNLKDQRVYMKKDKKYMDSLSLIKNVLNGSVHFDDLEAYLQTTDVVSPPKMCLHNIISDSKGNVWIIEPGKGNIYNPNSKSSFVVLSDFALCDYVPESFASGTEINRYKKVEEQLSNASKLTVGSALGILDSIKQTDGVRVTDFSMVYSQKEHCIYYCFGGNFDNVYQHVFKS